MILVKAIFTNIDHCCNYIALWGSNLFSSKTDKKNLQAQGLEASQTGRFHVWEDVGPEDPQAEAWK